MNRIALTEFSHFAGIIHEDALSALKNLPDGTFNVVITSPPYYWARDYGFGGQIGHEDTPEEYVKKLADIFDEVKRVLHSEGVFYLNIADTYYSGNGQPHGHDPRSPSRNFMREKLRAVDRSGWSIPKKSLIGIPWKVAFALQTRGWTLRSDIIWNRLNAFDEPTARDRPYRQYEHLFLFSKTRFYSYDRSALGGEEDVWTIPIERGKKTQHNASFPSELVKKCILTGSPPSGNALDPFMGSGTTVDVGLRLGRNVVGIDLGQRYVEETIKLLLARGCSISDWRKLEKALKEGSHQWNTWHGNKVNFRKPGTKKKDQTV
jgi:DNA modification methylase